MSVQVNIMMAPEVVEQLLRYVDREECDKAYSILKSIQDWYEAGSKYFLLASSRLVISLKQNIGHKFYNCFGGELHIFIIYLVKSNTRGVIEVDLNKREDIGKMEKLLDTEWRREIPITVTPVKIDDVIAHRYNITSYGENKGVEKKMLGYVFEYKKNGYLSVSVVEENIYPVIRSEDVDNRINEIETRYKGLTPNYHAIIKLETSITTEPNVQYL